MQKAYPDLTTLNLTGGFLWVLFSLFVCFLSVFCTLGLELQTQQSKHQDASCLPALKVSDIEPSMPFTKLDIGLAGHHQAIPMGAWLLGLC
jgi:hypothetical protein